LLRAHSGHFAQMLYDRCPHGIFTICLRMGIVSWQTMLHNVGAGLLKYVFSENAFAYSPEID